MIGAQYGSVEGDVWRAPEVRELGVTDVYGRVESMTRLGSAKRLVAAVLSQAMEDLALGGPVREDALQWFVRGGAEQAWSFLWCCEILRLSPSAVRQRLPLGWSGGPKVRRGAARALRIPRPDCRSDATEDTA